MAWYPCRASVVGTVTKAARILTRGPPDWTDGRFGALVGVFGSGEPTRGQVCGHSAPSFQALHWALQNTMMINVRMIVIAVHLVRLWHCFNPFPTSDGGNQLHFC